MDVRRFGDWTVIRPLGSGGMGHVFEARDARGRHAAIKVVRELSGQLLERFSRELSLLSSLGRTEGFVCLLDHGSSPAGPWIALEYASGGDLQRRLSVGPLSISDAIRIGTEISRALAIAHERELIHRDLKPANILFDESGRALVSDLGLGRRLFRPAGSDDISLTASGEGLGTLGYMAPEQMESARDAGPTADIWSIGVILYECLTGRRPWLATNPVELMQHMRSRRLSSVRELRPDCPVWLERLIDDCLQLDPAARIADADELADLLEEGPESERESALGAGVATALMLAGAAALLLAIAAVVVMRRAPEPGPTTPRRASADPKTPDGRSPDDPRPDNTGPDETPESTSETTGPDESPKPGPETPPETTPETTPPEETGPARERSSELVRRLTESGHFRLDQRLSDARLKPASLGTEVLWLDDRRFVTSDLSGLVLVHDAKTGETLRQFATRGEIIDIARGAGPNDLFLGDWRSGCWRTLDLATGALGEPQQVSSSGGSVFFAPLRGGDRLFLGTKDGLRVVRLDRPGALERRPAATLSLVLALDLSPDRRVLAAGGQRERADGRGTRAVLQLQDAETGAVIDEAELGELAEDLSFSPDGRRLAVAGRDGKLSIWSTRPLARVSEVGPLMTVGPTSFLRAVAWTRDGRQVICGGNDAELSLWASDLGGGSPIRRFGEHGSWIHRVAFSPDGTRVATVSNEPSARVFRLDGTPVVAPARPLGGVSFADRCGDKGEIMLLDRSGNHISEFAGGRHARRIRRPDFKLAMAGLLCHPEGRFWILSVAKSRELGRLRLFTRTQPQGEALEGPELGVVTGLCLDDDGHTVWFGDTRKQIWSFDTRTTKAQRHAGLTTSIKALQPLTDGRIAIVGGRGKVFTARPERLDRAPDLRLGSRTWCAEVARRSRRVVVNDVSLERRGDGKTYRLKSSCLIAASLAPADYGRETGRRSLDAVVDRILFSPDESLIAVVLDKLKAVQILAADTLEERARLSLELQPGLGVQNVLALTGGGLLVSTWRGEVVILRWARGGR